MGCRLPGGAGTPEDFWHLLDAGVDPITEAPAERWGADVRRGGVASTNEARAMRWGAFLKDVDLFDPQFFGISPREAASLDPQQRLALEVAWEALERGGQVPEKLAGTRAGVFLGVMTTDYQHLSTAGDIDLVDVYTVTGNGHCFPPGRLSYVFGLSGPSMAVDTACSSSLVAVHLACQSLRSGESSLALAAASTSCCCPRSWSSFRRPRPCRRTGDAGRSTPRPTVMSAVRAVASWS
jgi:myxalamid-type polyketide synthase MxaE and MxaD